MATVTPTKTVVELAPGNFQHTYVWPNMKLGDVGSPIGTDFIAYPGGVSMTGIAGAGERVAIEFSLDSQTNWAEQTAGSLQGPYWEVPVNNKNNWLRPHVVSGNDSTNVTVTFVGNRTYK
jgi:hypothetical protein